MDLNTQQQLVLNDLMDSIVQPNGVLIKKEHMLRTVGGFAGTGKTTLITEVRKKIYNFFPRTNVAFVTFTGKASSVLKLKLTENNSMFSSDYCGTIHGLIYVPETKWDKKLKTFVVTGWRKKDLDELFYDIIIIDEASMVSKDLFDDLAGFNIPILAFGDHGQLPPVKEDNFSLMKKPDFTLTEIHRQALNSPILKLSQIVREEGYIPYGFQSNKVFKLSWDDPLCKRIWNEKIEFVDPNLAILCSFNKTRTNLNIQIRNKLNFKEKAPYPGEKIICLCNNHNLKIMNGQIGNVIWVIPDDKSYRVTMEMDAEIYDCLVSDKCFGQVTYTMYDNSKETENLKDMATKRGYQNIDYFDYGYVMSVHKSQGSEWQKIVLVEQRASMWDDTYYARLLYTAITRARESLFVITDMWI